MTQLLIILQWEFISEIRNIIKFKIKTGYYLELITSETTELVGCNKSKITEDKNSENVPHLKLLKWY